MRTVVVLPPPLDARTRLPSVLRQPIDEAALREWLADADAASHLFEVPADESLEDTVTRVLGLGGKLKEHVLVVYLAAHAHIDDQEWASLGLDLIPPQEYIEQELDQVLSEAAQHFTERRWDQARSYYRTADQLMQHESGLRRGAVLGRLGHIELMLGSRPAALKLLDRALAMSPQLPLALRARASAAKLTDEHALATAMLYRLIPLIAEEQERLQTLEEMVLASLDAARDALMRALTQRPGDRDLLEKLCAVHSAAGRWDEAVSVSVQLAEGISERERRAAALVAAADMCSQKTGNTPRAVALYEAAIEDDPTVPRAFGAIEAVLRADQDYHGMVEAYERQLERLETADADEEIVAQLKKLAAVHRDHLDDPEEAIRALDRIATLRPDDVEARTTMAELLDAMGETALAARCLEVSAQHAPAQPEIYRTLYALLSRSGDDDGVYAACSALVSLGDAHIDERQIHSQLAPHAPLRPQRPFGDDVWQQLFPDGHDGRIDAILVAIEQAAIDSWFERRDKAPPLPDDRYRQDPEAGSVMAVRSFAWASELLVVPRPTIYVAPDNTRVGVATLPAREEAVLLGRPILTGRSIVELSFVAARHLSLFRRGWRLLTFYPDLRDLNALILAAMAIARPDLMMPASLRGPALDVRGSLEGRLDKATVAVIGQVAEELQAEDAQLDLGAWRRSVETSCCRAGLLATGDVTVAGPVLASTAARVAGLTAAQRTHDLLAFSVSQPYATLRHLLGLGVTLEPPPESSGHRLT